MILWDLPTLKCSEQTSAPAAIVYSLPSSQRIPWIHCFPVDANAGQFLSLLVAFKNTKTSRHSEIKQTSPSTKQDFSGGALNGRFPFDQIFWFEIPGIPCDEWNSIFRCVGLTNPRSSGSKFRAKIRDQTEYSFTFAFLLWGCSTALKLK